MPATPRAPLALLASGEQGLPRDVAAYLVKVLRLRAGDVFEAFDPERAIEADVELLSDVPPRARVGELRSATRVPVYPLVMLSGLAKSDKPEQIARAAVALGVTELVFVRAARSVAGAELKHARLRSVMLDAARQCGRGNVPLLAELATLDAALARAQGSRLVLAPHAEQSLLAVLQASSVRAGVTLAVGPEGGFDEAELEALAGAGFRPARLAPLILRTELAAVAALAVVTAVASD
jgi:16S rRNA (uracil1498-N3)-methyltransferase